LLLLLLLHLWWVAKVQVALLDSGLAVKVHSTGVTAIRWQERKMRVTAEASSSGTVP
jgi:hypothetical protein